MSKSTHPLFMHITYFFLVRFFIVRSFVDLLHPSHYQLPRHNFNEIKTMANFFGSIREERSDIFGRLSTSQRAGNSDGREWHENRKTNEFRKYNLTLLARATSSRCELSDAIQSSLFCHTAKNYSSASSWSLGCTVFRKKNSLPKF